MMQVNGGGVKHQLLVLHTVIIMTTVLQLNFGTEICMHLVKLPVKTQYLNIHIINTVLHIQTSFLEQLVHCLEQVYFVK